MRPGSRVSAQGTALATAPFLVWDIGLLTDKPPSSIKLPAAVADIYRAVTELEREFPNLNFTPDGHMVGSIGEAIAAKHFGLKLLRASYPGHDATDTDERLVQIKLTAGKNISLYADCDRLIVLRIVSPEQAEIVYDGPGAPVWAAAGTMQKNGQRKISLAKLREFSRVVPHPRAKASSSRIDDRAG
jgi:hypothetical protein